MPISQYPIVQLDLRLEFQGSQLKGVDIVIAPFRGNRLTGDCFLSLKQSLSL